MNYINSYKLDIETIENKTGLVKDSLKLNMLKKIEILPFDSTGNIKTDIEKYDIIIKVVFQQLLNIKPVELDESHELIEKNIEKVETGHRNELKNIFEELYFEEGQLKTFHPKIFIYQGKVKKSIENIATFFVNSFMEKTLKNEVEIMMKSEPQHLFDKMMIDALPEHEYKEIEKSGANFSLIPEIQEKFIEDFKFISEDEQLFLENVSKLIKYYLFFYSSQVIMNLKAGFKRDVQIYPVHYFLEWEKISKTRPSYIKGWKMIQSKSKDIFAYTNLIQILNQTEDKSFKGSFPDIKKILDQSTKEERVEFEASIEYLSSKIRSIHQMPELNLKSRENIFGEYQCLDRLLVTMCDCKDKGTSKRDGAYDKYEKSIRDIAKGDFIKPRGQLGSTLSLTQEWIVFFTKLAIGYNEKIRLNELWEDFEKRGLFFDKLSKDNIVQYFEKINVLEKKSDSGDAQYVRIL